MCRKCRTIEPAPPPRLPPRALAVVVSGALLLAAWLDVGRDVHAQRAEIFSAIWTAITWLGDLLGTVGGAIATTVEAAIVYLSTAVGWLAAQVATILINTGSMFAKVWEWGRLIYSDVLKPALVWLHDVYTRISGWLGNFFKPVFDFLSHVRAILLDVYTRFLSPILKGLDIAHAILRTLADLHIQWAATLDRWVEDIRTTITENFIRVLGWVNEVRDIVNSIVTPDRLLQRLPFVRTLERDAAYLVRLWWNAQIAPPNQAALDAARARTVDELAAADLAAQLGAYLRDGSGDLADGASACVDDWRVALSA